LLDGRGGKRPASDAREVDPAQEIDGPEGVDVLKGGGRDCCDRLWDHNRRQLSTQAQKSAEMSHRESDSCRNDTVLKKTSVKVGGNAIDTNELLPIETSEL
jgi:hypothetical protein